MNRLASAVSLALLLSIGSCGDDDKPAVDASAAGDGGSTDGGGALACTGSFMGVTSTQLAGAIAMSSGTKSCAADVNLVCTGNIAGIAGTCGLGCVSTPADMRKACVTTCIKGQLAALSDGCTGCYADTVLCAQNNCLTPCLGGTASEACVACQIEKGCRSMFAQCSGLPTGAPPADGGAAGDGGGTTDGGATDAAATDGGASDTAAADVAASDTAAADTAAADTAVSADSATTD